MIELLLVWPNVNYIIDTSITSYVLWVRYLVGGKTVLGLKDV